MRCFTKSKLEHLNIGECKGAPRRLMRLKEEDKLHEQREAKCKFLTNNETNFHLDEEHKLHE